MKNIYYDISKILSYNKLFNFIIGPRGNGKSFAAKKLVINNFIKKNKQFVYVRRYKTEMEHLTNFFSDIAMFYPDHTFEVEGKKFKIDGQLAGYAITLSTSQKEKSTSYPDVDYIIFDEFIIGKGKHVYLKNEVTVFFDLYETIARMRDVKAIFISNSVTSMNPYFSYFKIVPNMKSKFVRGEEWVCERCDASDYKDVKRNTRFGRLIAGTQYGEYAIENEFLEDNYAFIEKMPPDMHCISVLRYMNKDYTLWYGDCGYYYISDRKGESNIKFSLTTSDDMPNYIMLKTYKNHHVFKMLRYAYSIGYMRFENLACKTMFYELINLI
ncbi:MAG: phage DNA encapsidation protein [Roseburia sp.]|nr:phage DNA encapsidation protein [Roseburia sp.]